MSIKVAQQGGLYTPQICCDHCGKPIEDVLAVVAFSRLEPRAWFAHKGICHDAVEARYGARLWMEIGGLPIMLINCLHNSLSTALLFSAFTGLDQPALEDPKQWVIDLLRKTAAEIEGMEDYPWPQYKEDMSRVSKR